MLRAIPALLLILSLCVASHASNANDINQEEALELRRAGKIMPLQDILDAIAKRHPNLQVLEIELELEHDRYIYEIEILTANNTVRELEVDAQNAEIIDDELGD